MAVVQSCSEITRGQLVHASDPSDKDMELILSIVDILYIGRMMPKHAAIMAKKSIRLIPGLGWFMMLSGTVFIDRGNAQSAISSMDQAGADMKRKRVGFSSKIST
jgi:hypothetical protein